MSLEHTGTIHFSPFPFFPPKAGGVNAVVRLGRRLNTDSVPAASGAGSRKADKVFLIISKKLKMS